MQLPDLTFERALWPHYPLVAGLDEAGRGALAGPVAVGAVILPGDDPHLSRTLAGCRDSKQMTPLQRERCASHVRAVALAWNVAYASAAEIDQLGIVRAVQLAAERALKALSVQPLYLLTDFRLELPESETPHASLVKGDARSLSIAAASVLAKTARDALMVELGKRNPAYGWEKNKGYGTQAHRSALKRWGYSPQHRRSFVVRELRKP